MPSVFLIAARSLRAPLILIVLLFSISTVGLTLIPGIDELGQPWRMSIFHAIYFATYTSTTIGFGEIPHAFTDAQRLFAIVIIYLSVIGWTYLLGTLLSLAQDKAFQQALVAARFRRVVRGLHEPFFLVCGLGETGMTVARALDRLGTRFTAIDLDERRVQELELEETSLDVPVLAADVRSAETLESAGLLKPECQGVLALCNNDDTNLAVALAVGLLRPDLPLISRADTPATAALMQTFGSCRVISPSQDFADHLGLALRAPETDRLLAWLTGTPGSWLPPSLPPRIPMPPGHWLICGHGRYGSAAVAAIQRAGFRVTVVDPAGLPAIGLHRIEGLATDTAVLRDAGAETACGVFAGTDDDTANLAIALAARRINPGVFVILRQNLQASGMLFGKFGADMTMVISRIIANECLAALRTPQLADFLDLVRRRDDLFAYALAESLRVLVGDEVPRFWSLTIGPLEAPGLLSAAARLPLPLTVGALCCSPRARADRLLCLALLLVRDGTQVEVPGDEEALRLGDRLLFAGQRSAEADQALVLRDANAAAYVLSGRREAEGWLWRWAARRWAEQHGTSRTAPPVGP